MTLRLFFCVMCVASLAQAQTAANTGILVAPDGQCLDLAGAYNTRKPPPSGTAVVLASCDGRPSQRWTATFGDYNDIRSVGGLFLVAALRGPAGVTLAVHGSSRVTDLRMHRETIVSGSDCLTQPTAGVARFTLSPCSGAASQRWRMR